MLNGLYLSAMGARVQDLRVEVLSNNLANVNTPGFRRDRAVFRMRLPEAEARPELASRGVPRYEKVGGGVWLERTASVDENGPLEETGNPLDVAIDGEGFLRVRGQDGSVYYTRAGNLRRDAEGFLCTADGRYRVQVAGGGDIEVPPGEVDIDAEGRIRQDGAEVGQIGVVMPADPEAMRKVGDNLWIAPGAPGELPAAAFLRAGFRELSGVEPTREITEMIEAQRTYELNLRALRIQDEILGRTVSDVGRPTP